MVNKNSYNIVIGYNAGKNITTAQYNTAIGSTAMAYSYCEVCNKAITDKRFKKYNSICLCEECRSKIIREKCNKIKQSILNK